jgi:hypothetical protein
VGLRRIFWSRMFKGKINGKFKGIPGLGGREL